jgi:Cu+-exporting ATPase
MRIANDHAVAPGGIGAPERLSEIEQQPVSVLGLEDDVAGALARDGEGPSNSSIPVGDEDEKLGHLVRVRAGDVPSSPQAARWLHSAAAMKASVSYAREIPLPMFGESQHGPVVRGRQIWALAAVVGIACWASRIAGSPGALELGAALMLVVCAVSLGFKRSLVIGLAMRKARARGVFFRRLEDLENLTRVDTLVVERSGALTDGRPLFVGAQSNGRFGECELLAWAAALENGHEHPLAVAVVREAAARRLVIPVAKDTRVVPGQGVRGTVAGQEVVVGNRRCLTSAGIDVPGDSEQRRIELNRVGQRVVHVGVGGLFAGSLVFEERALDSAGRGLRDLEARGLKVTFMSGEERAFGGWVARLLGVELVAAGADPEQKAACLAGMRAAGRNVALLTEGLDDSATLEFAKLVIVPTSGNPLALRRANLELTSADLSGIAYAHAVANGVSRVARQNRLLGVATCVLTILPLLSLLTRAGAERAWAFPLALAAGLLGALAVVGNTFRLGDLAP